MDDGGTNATLFLKITRQTLLAAAIHMHLALLLGTALLLHTILLPHL